MLKSILNGNKIRQIYSNTKFLNITSKNVNHINSDVLNKQINIVQKRNVTRLLHRAVRDKIPGFGLKMTPEEVTKQEENSAVLTWMNKQQKAQEEAKSKGKKVPDAKLYRRFLFKYILFACIVGLTYKDLLEYFEREFEEAEFMSFLPSYQSKPRITSNLKEADEDNNISFSRYKESETPLVKIYHHLPLRFLSRVWGRLNDIEFPKFILVPLLKSYCEFFNVNMEEALFEDLSSYKTVGQFFRRPLKPEVRPISDASNLVSPADGKVLISGIIEDGFVDEIKHLSYSLPTFLGPLATKPELVQKSIDNKSNILHNPKEYQKLLLKNPDNELHYCVIYLSPGDCHRYFSPVEWKVKHRRHFPGELLSVNPSVVRKVPKLFAVNERVVLTGEWEHGYFSMSPVGATNVGSIVVYEDVTLMTNRVNWKRNSYYDCEFGEGLAYDKGELLGEFNMGSSIVLIFEAPKGYKMNLGSGQVVKYGEAMLE